MLQIIPVRHAPNDARVTIPTIVISEEQFQYIKDHPRATISTVFVHSSYKGIDITLEAQSTSLYSHATPSKWQTKMYLPVSMVAADMTQAYVRKTDSISSKMIHTICPGRTNLQVDETPSIDELQAEVNYTTATRKLQVVDVQPKPPH